ncbi:MAG: signal peptidase II [Candidatus Pacearchaeota archaeon]
MLKKHIFFAILFLFLFLLDRITKILFLNKNFEKNKGSFFGILQNFPLLIIILSIFMIFFLIYYYFKEKNFYFRLGLIFIISGIFSNLFDRIFYGYVIDWISFFNFSIFNIADCYLCIGIILCLVSFLNLKNIK